jgi:type I restriction enzyme S subunit
MTVVSKASAYPKSVQSGLPKLGACPVGWSRGPLAAHLYEALRPVEMEDDAVYDLVTVKRSRGGVVLRERLKGSEIAVKSQFRVKSGDFLISKRQIVHGACGIVPPALDGAIVSNEYSILRARPSLDIAFLNCLAHSIHFQQTCFHSSIGVHVEKMIFKLDQWLRWEFDLPPLAEQQRIAEILNTWDHANEVVGELASNARANKSGLIQSLMGGTRPPPKAQNTHATTTLGQVAEVIVSNVDKKSDATASPVRLCNYTDVYHNDRIDADMHFMAATATTAQIRNFALRAGDVLITKDSETPADIAVPSYVASTAADLVCGYHLAIVRPNPTLDGRFLKFYFEHPHTRHFFASRANGATRFGLTIDAIQKAPIALPAYDQQQRIGQQIETAEREIGHLAKVGLALRKERAALIQQLLTGKRRGLSTERDAA